MTLAFQPATGLLAQLSLLRIETAGPVVHIRLNRPAKRNSVSDEMIGQIHTAFVNLPADARVAVVSGEGEHFCAGLDLSEVTERNVAEGIFHSRIWHAAFDQVQYGRVPVIAVLHGAVVGGGLELASSAHLRVAEASTFYGLPEGTRGIFVGGGGSARIPRLIGVARMTDLMLTGRVFDAQEGQAIGISNYLVGDGEGLAKAFELASRIAGNAPLSNYAITQALPRIADMAQSDGLFVESLISAIAQGDEAAKERVRAFLEKRAGKVAKST
jgi:(methylthio)acryloyl-CoA hydratase